MAKRGRPTEYEPKRVIKATLKYLEKCEDTEQIVTLPVLDIHGNEVSTRKEVRSIVKVPTLEGLAYHLGVHKDTIQDWKGKFPEFSVLIGRLLSKQAERLVNKGLSGEYNPTIAKVLLTKHGYREGVDMTSDDKTLQPSPESVALANKALDEFLKNKNDTTGNPKV